jgi:CCR4-NOT transcription complex subunit 4
MFILTFSPLLLPPFLCLHCRDSSVCSQKEHVSEQLASNNDKSQASAQLGNDTSSNSKQTISAENGSSDISLQKPQYVSVVSQGQGGSARRFTVLTRQGASTDSGPKSIGQIVNGTSNSTKHTLMKNECSDSFTILRGQNVNPVSQKPESLHPWVSKSAKSHAQAEKKNESSDISAKLAPGNLKQLSEYTVSNSPTAVHIMSGRPMLSNLSTSDAKYQASARAHNLSGSNVKLGSQNQLQLVNQQREPVSDTGIAKASPSFNILNNQVPFCDSKRQNSGQGGPHCLYNREITRSHHCSNSTPVSKPLSAASATDMVPPGGKGRKKQVCCPPGFEKLQHSSDSSKFVSLNSTRSEPCSTTDALVQDSCSITDQQHIISMVSQCLDDGDVVQNKNVNTSSPIMPPSSTDTIWRRAQFPDTYFSGLSNHTQIPPYPHGFLQCTLPPVSCTSYQQPSYFDGTTGSYMSTGAYDSFHQGMAAGMVGTLLQQQPMSSPRHGWTHGNADSGMNCPQVDISYPRGYTLF